MPTHYPDDDQPPTGLPITKGGHIAHELERSGYTTVAFLHDEAVAALRDIYESLGLESDHDFFASSNDLTGPEAGAVAGHITGILGDLLEQVLPDHEPFLASFLTKGRLRGSMVSFHQDLSYTDERRHRTTLLWIPLCDVDARNGAVAVVPGSHRWSDGCRPGGALPLPTERHQEALSELARVVPLRVGEALVYDAAIVHGSGPNATDEPRPAVGVALVPRGADLVHVHVDDDGGPTAWSVDANFYTSQSLRSRPEGYVELDVWAPPSDDAELRSAVAAARDGRRRPVRPILADAAADESLQVDGFTLVDLPGATELADDLRIFYEEHHGPAGEGFEPDLVNPDLTYRASVSDRLAAALDEPVSELFDDHEPFLRVFLAKWPGPQSDLYLHRDWMYVDERTWGHTYVVWIPLCDVDERNGPLQVLRGSHRIDDSLRGTNLNAPWINHHDVVVPRLETLTVHLGQAVVMDNALVHSSLPNPSGELRLVAAVGMRPTGAPLVHFLRADDDTAWRFDVDDSFLTTTTPQELMGAPPELPVVERLPAGQRFWTEVELLTVLGEVPQVPPQARSDEVEPPHRRSWWRRLRRRVGVG